MRADGADLIRFLFTANRNTSLQPIEKVASGGEMSRLMLSLKALVAAHAQLPTIIFDEIDTGVSGAIADKMGEIITNLSGSLQVVNITHLPQVASKSDHHFLVYKEETPEGDAVPHPQAFLGGTGGGDCQNAERLGRDGCGYGTGPVTARDGKIVSRSEIIGQISLFAVGSFSSFFSVHLFVI
ncbi:MAG: hypothetical protein ACLR8Y_18465 [Alistipes indistinctus]